MLPEDQNPRQRLLESLRGQELHVPDLQPLFKHWPQSVNPNLDRLRKDVDERLKSLFPEGARLQKLRAADAALFGASWWPYAPFEQLKIATYLSIWLFAWDDEMDSAEFSSLTSNLNAARQFRAATVEYVRRSLIGDESLESPVPKTSSIVTSFKPIAEAISRFCSPAQIMTFFGEFLFFVNMTDVEHEIQMSSRLPTVEEYQQRRMGSSAVGMCLAITEYCFGIDMRADIMVDDDMKTIWDETNVIISTVNDILSILKEVKQDRVDSLIPLLYVCHESLDIAVAKAVEIVQISISTFELASQRLLDRYSEDLKAQLDIQKFIYGCMCACTANLNWSLQSGRYRLDTCSLRDGLSATL